MNRTRRYIPNIKVIKTKYLSLITEEDNGTYTITIGSAVTTANLAYIEYSTDNAKTWTKITNVNNSTVTQTIPNIPYKHIVMLRGDGIRTAAASTSTTADNNTRIKCSCKFSVRGCIATLLYGKYANEDTLLQNTYSFAGLFVGAKIIDIDNLIFPKNVTTSCYASLFYGCSFLTHVPKLPATTLAQSCYRAMFYDCTSLEIVDELPALTLTQHCYYQMFYGCTSLKYIKMLGTNVTADSCLYRWLPDPLQNLEFHRNPEATWWITGVNGIPTQSILFDDTEEIAEEETFIDTEINNILINKFGNKIPVVSFDRWQDKIKIAGVNGKILKRQVHHVIQIYNEFTSNTNIVDFSDLNKFINLKYIGSSSLTTYYSTNPVGFYNCTSLKYITFPDTLINLGAAYTYGKGCFMNTAIENIYIPDNVKATSDSIFNNCTSLKTIRWGNSLPVRTNTTIYYNYIFYKCTQLEQITNFPTTATAFGKYHFSNCTRLDMTPVIPLIPQITTLGAYAFQGCANTNLPNALFFLKVTNDDAYMTTGLGRRKLYLPSKTKIIEKTFIGNSAELIDLGNVTGTYFYPGNGNSSTNTVTVVLRSTAVPTFSTFNKTNVRRIYVYQDIISDFITTYSAASTITYPIGGTEWIDDYGNEDEYADWSLYSYAKNTAPTRLDTGICADDNTKIEVKLWSNVTGSFYSFGTRESSSGSHLFSLTGSYSNQSVMCEIGKTNTTATNFVRSASGYTYTTTMQTNGDMTYSFTITDGTDTFTANNVTYSESLEGNDKHIYLFSNGFNDIAATIRFYYVKIWQNGTLIMHLKPCDINGTPCMLDMVTMKQFTADNIEYE